MTTDKRYARLMTRTTSTDDEFDIEIIPIGLLSRIVRVELTNGPEDDEAGTVKAYELAVVDGELTVRQVP